MPPNPTPDVTAPTEVHPDKDMELQDPYGVRFEVILTENGSEVPAKSIIYHTLQNLKSENASSTYFNILDAYNDPLPNDITELSEDEILIKFCVQVIGQKRRKLVFGLHIQSDFEFSRVKDKCHKFCKERSIYMKLHVIDFSYGAHWVNVGFFMNTHPIYGPNEELLQQIVTDFRDGWLNDSDYWTDKRKNDLINTYNESYKGEFPLKYPPMIISPNTITAKPSKGKLVRTYASALLAPSNFAPIGKMIMDYLIIHKQSVKNYVPSAFRTENCDQFVKLLQQHEKWMDNHRNIQITNIYDRESFDMIQSSTTNQTLHQTLMQNKEILQLKYDNNRNRVNLSVHVNKYISTIQWVDSALKTADFPFGPQVKKPKQYSTLNNESPGNSTTDGTKATYADILANFLVDSPTEGSDTDNNEEPRQHPRRTQGKSNRWARRSVPTTINCKDVGEFPPLSKKKTTKKKGKQSKGTNQPDHPSNNLVSQEFTTDTATVQSEHTQVTSNSSKTKSKKSTQRPHSPTNDSLTNSSVGKTSISDIISSLTSKHQKEVEELRADIRQLNTLVVASHQKNLDLENRMAQLITFFESQRDRIQDRASPQHTHQVVSTPTKQQDQPTINIQQSGAHKDNFEVVRANKRTINSGDFTTPVKTSPLTIPLPSTPVIPTTNYYAALYPTEDQDEIMIDKDTDTPMEPATALFTQPAETNQSTTLTPSNHNVGTTAPSVYTTALFDKPKTSLKVATLKQTTLKQAINKPDRSPKTKLQALTSVLLPSNNRGAGRGNK